MHTIKRKDGQGETMHVEAKDLLAACERLSDGGRFALDVAMTTSDFGDGKQIVSSDAKARIEAQHTVLAANGVQVNNKEQLFATGTRLASVGYDSQTERKAEHDRQAPVREVAAALIAQVRSERRDDKIVTAKALADSLEVNGAIKVLGHALSEQAIRGLCGRLESPMLGYVLGLRERIAARAKLDTDESREMNTRDKRAIASVIRHECFANPDEVLKLRTREVGSHGRPDVYAIVSEGYSPADAPEAIDQVLASLPHDARGTFAYDVASTSWELRASVWTPTPVAEQAVGEAFQGYVSFQSKDNGTGKFNGGGGVTLLRCLNASTYVAEGSKVSRVHRGRVLYDVNAMLRGGLQAIEALCKAWGTNRASEIAVPMRADKPVSLEEAIPGFWAYCLRARGSELAGVLPGRTSEHVKGLSQAFFAERRDPSKLVRSDLAQGWTRWIQNQPSDIRREAESAIGSWLVNPKPIKCELKEVGA